jgi:hypothetical protein
LVQFQGFLHDGHKNINGDGSRIDLQCFMVEVVEAGFGLVNEFTREVRIWEMTLYACKLLVVRDMPPQNTS